MLSPKYRHRRQRLHQQQQYNPACLTREMMVGKPHANERQG